MPHFEVKTVSANEVWSSPDGQRKIYDLQLEWEGKPMKASTYSEAIASPGWSGTVETYEKPGKYGPQTFVKQPPKEGGYSGPRSGGGSKPQADQFTMYLSYAKDLAIASVTTTAGKLSFNSALYSELLEAVEAGGAQLYASRDGAPKKGDEISVEDLQLVLDGEPVDPGETPWPKN